MAVIDEQGALELSRADLMALAAQVETRGPDALAADPVAAPLLGHALTVGFARAHLMATEVRTGTVRRNEVWLAPSGVVALAQQADPSTAGPVVGLPPFAAHVVAASALALDPAARAHPGTLPAPSGLAGLVEQVRSGSADDAVLTVLDWTVSGVPVRWVVVDVHAGRVASLSAPQPIGSEFTMLPVSPMRLAVELATVVADAIRPI